MKAEFLNFIHKLMEANPDITNEYMTDSIKNYLAMLEDDAADKPEITEKGCIILKLMQQNNTATMYKAKDIAQELALTSRGVSGSLRKLANDGFCEKIGSSPAVYTITEKGKNYIFND